MATFTVLCDREHERLIRMLTAVAGSPERLRELIARHCDEDGVVAISDILDDIESQRATAGRAKRVQS